MNSNRGIYRVSKRQLNDFADGRINRIESIGYGKVDGLNDTEGNGGQQPAAIKARDGKLWFPTQGGVAVIDPEKINTNRIASPVVIESAKVDNETGFPAFCSNASNTLKKTKDTISYLESLIATERHILNLIAEYKTSREIGDELLSVSAPLKITALISPANSTSKAATR